MLLHPIQRLLSAAGRATGIAVPAAVALAAGTMAAVSTTAAAAVAQPAVARTIQQPAGAAGTSGTAGAAGTSGTAGAAGTSGTAGAAGSAVLLVNGDRVTAAPGPGGRTTDVLLPAPGTGTLFALSMGGNHYYIPAYALPFVGHGLSPSLFNVADLRRAETDSRLPVQVSYSGHRPALPGITITRTGSRTASGYLTTTSARIFGAALARQYRADHSRASYGTDGLFAAATSITLSGTSASAARTRTSGGRRGFPMATLTVTGTDLAGQPDTGDPVEVLNAADWHRFGDPLEALSFFYHGVAKFSVPAGTYWATGYFSSLTSTSTRIVVLPQFTVGRSGATVHLAAGSASSKITMMTPRPSVPEFSTILVVRGGAGGTSASVESFGASTWINPTTRRPTVGTLRSYTDGDLRSPASVRGTPYEYLLAMTGPPGIIPAQRYVISAASLAAVRDRYYQDKPSTGLLLSWGGTLAQWGIIVVGQLVPFSLPGTRIQYLSAGSSVVWESGYFSSDSRLAGGQSGDLEFRPGQQVTERWGQYPLHPQIPANTLHGIAARALPTELSAFRVGDKLVLRMIIPFTDNEFGHFGDAVFAGQPIGGVTGRYALYQNGTEIGHGNPFTDHGIASVLGTSARLRSRPSVIRLALTATRRSSLFPSSTSATTVWTWRSHRRPGAHVPPSWFCRLSFPRPVLHTCAVQPMMTLDYHVHRMALDGTTPAGRQMIGLDVGHIQLGGSARITGATARVSGDGGRTWRAATVTAHGHGHFTITFSARAGTHVTLRVAAADSAGGSITETIRDAYCVRS